ncbi:hypothetical protein CKAH01_09324 [Colletotrichum kahawae]|uniref:Uncharacterized protein n=1 Tax=Colletotrichum kahawae TaxID=34407 RepID=A0AAD9Y0V2_COLKA|nr:hypothetical protein CKAH01_09324 [Colletotrichum kahawae]
MQHHFPVPHQHSSSTYFTPATKSATQSDFLSLRFSLSPPISFSPSIILHIFGIVHRFCSCSSNILAHHISTGFGSLSVCRANERSTAQLHRFGIANHSNSFVDDSEP